MLATLVLNSWPQAVHPPRPPKVLGLQVWATVPSSSFSFFWVLNVSSHSLLAWKVSAEKFSGSLTEVPLYMVVWFFLAVFNTLPLVFDTLIVMCLGGSLWIDLIWFLLGFLDLAFHFLPQAWEVFCHYFFEYVTYFLLLALIMRKLFSMMVSHKSLTLSLLSFIIFSFCPWD